MTVDLTTALLLGILQGIVEWLPVSSEGVVATTYAYLEDRPLGASVGFALWLHLGTAVSATIYFRRELVAIARELLSRPRHPSPLLRFLIVGTVVSVVIGLPLLLALDQLSERIGSAAMGVVGVLMLVTGFLQLRRPQTGALQRDEVTAQEAIVTGAAQGLAALPGLSRSGLTVAALLALRVDRREALALSFLLSIPASLGGALFAAIDSKETFTVEGIAGAAVAAVVGLLTIRGLMAFAQRVNFGALVIVVGLAIIAGSLLGVFVVT